MAEIRYPAFLSYSHRDQAVAEWLHHALETYHVPSRMVGRETSLGPIPPRLTPIFKDRDELSAAGSLGEAITAALGRASALIVVCSPAAATSPWVNEEVLAFKRLHGHARIFAVIVDGEPGASRIPGREQEECFPPAVRFAVGADGQLTDTAAEPIAADLRPGGDGRRLAKLKLVAGLLGVGLDEIVQREAQRRARRLRYLVAASLAGMTVTSGLAVTAVMARDEAREQRNEAQHQRAQADGLVEFMLTDLRKKLEPVGRLDVMDTVGRRALTYYALQNPAKLDPDALGRRARALQLVAEVRNLRGDSDGALVAFRQAAATTSELLARNPNDGQRIFDHAQSVFWVGYIAWQRGDIQTGRQYFSEYLKQAQKLVRLDPHNEAWAAELGFAHGNLGTLELDDNQPAKSLNHFNNAERVFAGIRDRASDKRDPSYYLAQDIAGKADARRALLDLPGALNDRRRETAMYQALLATDPNDSKAKEGLAVAQYRSAQLQLEMGSGAQAAFTAGQSFEGIRRLLAQDPSNHLWQEIAIKAANIRVESLMMTGNLSAAREANAWALGSAAKLVATDRTVADWRNDCLLPARWMQIALSGKDARTARQLTAAFDQDFIWDSKGKATEDERFAWIMVDVLDGLHWRSIGEIAKAQASFARAVGRFPSDKPTDARLLAVAGYLRRFQHTSGLPEVAPATAGRVQYDVGALLSAKRG
ncbi:MAG TPA: toll/interleukin-1 receptor domain-containing protein [Sphingomicrobium sp.]|nr:toll/interleukin-1 receptor domain-containing protein [Sphingomicrobium sp.]